MIMQKGAELSEARNSNALREKLIVESRELADLEKSLRTYKDALLEIKTRVVKENDEFRTRRLQYLNEIITEGISNVFPEKHLSAEVLCDFKRKNSVKLRLTDDKGNVFIPYISNGKLMQYLISFYAVSGIAQSLGSHNLYIDEAFGVASAENLQKMGDNIAKSIEQDGFQIILVSQSSLLYTDIPRREINLQMDDASKCAKVTSVDDYTARR